MTNRGVSMGPAAAIGLVIMIVAAMGCAAHRDNIFQNSVRAYNKALKWKEYDKAGTFVADSYKDRFKEATAVFEKDQLNIVDYEVVDMKLEKQDSSAKSTVKIEYYWELDGRLQHTTRDEKWVYEDESWKIVPCLEDFKH